MSKLYSQNVYINPFRHRKFDNEIDQVEVLEGVLDNIEPFLNERFTLIKDYIDELGDFKSEARIIRFIRNKLNTKLNVFNFSFNNLERYNTNLRYLELPLQPMVDKNGFEVQFLSNELLEDAIEEIDEGFSYVYEYCAQKLPETIDLWVDYAELTPREFPFIAHDSILESTYEIFDKIFDDFQKNSMNFFNWFISGDVKTNLLKVSTPKINQTIKYYLFLIFKQLLFLTFVLFTLKYILLKFNTFIKREDVKFLIRYEIKSIKAFFSNAKQDLRYKGIRIVQINKKIKSKIFKFKNKCEYKILRIIRKIYYN